MLWKGKKNYEEFHGKALLRSIYIWGDVSHHAVVVVTTLRRRMHNFNGYEHL